MGIGGLWEGVGKAIYVDVFEKNDLATAAAMYAVTGMQPS